MWRPHDGEIEIPSGEVKRWRNKQGCFMSKNSGVPLFTAFLCCLNTFTFGSQFCLSRRAKLVIVFAKSKYFLISFPLQCRSACWDGKGFRLSETASSPPTTYLFLEQTCRQFKQIRKHSLFLKHVAVTSVIFHSRRRWGGTGMAAIVGATVERGKD